MRTFSQLDTTAFDDAIVIVDIDGTLTNDRSYTLEPAAAHTLRALAQRARVYLCSNGSDEKRVRMLADETGTQALFSRHKKPSARVIDGVAREGKRVVVIGDKRLTDGRFARNIGAEFIRVGRLTHSSDRWHISGIYFLDDAHTFAYASLRLVRPMQWIKNLLVFAPLFFADAVLDPRLLGNAALAFVAFCAASSAVYVMNDLADREQDRAHPHKRARPIASGEIEERGAIILIITFLALAAAALSYIPAMAPIILLYLALNAAYSFGLKHIAVADILCVAVFYVLRVLAGGEATGVYVSPWIILCVLFGALVLVIGKRRAEFAHDSHRIVLKNYSKGALDVLLASSATLAVVSYALYSVIAARSPLVVYSTIFVVLAVFRIVNRLYSDDADAEFPEKLLFKDPVALGAGVLWALYLFVILYA